MSLGSPQPKPVVNSFRVASKVEKKAEKK